ncbi:MAG: hypothetical protein WA948_03865 [Pontixanthobacter sp.]
MSRSPGLPHFGSNIRRPHDLPAPTDARRGKGDDRDACKPRSFHTLNRDDPASPDPENQEQLRPQLEAVIAGEPEWMELELPLLPGRPFLIDPYAVKEANGDPRIVPLVWRFLLKGGTGATGKPAA